MLLLVTCVVSITGVNIMAGIPNPVVGGSPSPEIGGSEPVINEETNKEGGNI